MVGTNRQRGNNRGQRSNAGNFANRSKEEVREAGRKGGESSRSGRSS